MNQLTKRVTPDYCDFQIDRYEQIISDANKSIKYWEKKKQELIKQKEADEWTKQTISNE